MLRRADIRNYFSEIGVKRGDILVVQSSYRGMGEVEGGPQAVVEALIDLVGEEGTLIMPAYNFTSWTEAHYFDIKETPSTMGTITETFRLSSNVRRTKHPIHSLSVCGRLKDELCEMDYEKSFGNDSVFPKLLEYGAIYSTLGTGLETPFLSCHYAEAMMTVPYRRPKRFSGVYVDESGIPSLRTYCFDVRKDVSRKSPVYPSHVMLFERGVVKKSVFGDLKIIYAKAGVYHDGFIEMINEKPELFR